MDDRDWLAERFEAHRPRLRAVAWRLLGSAAEADDAVQEAWLRLHRSGPQTVDNLGGWLTTVVARVCLDMLRARGSRREEPLEGGLPDRVVGARAGAGPEDQALLAEGVGPALLEQMDWAEAETADNDRITLYVAFNYGARAEILDAAERYTGGGEEAFRELLYAPEMHDPDLLIRTSGEQRISNYLLWQLAYSELVFVDELWPDFSREAFRAALDAFEGRQRRFGAR
jgi:DNA-directed RNA polymerase specialized sigma24 family protein